MLLSLHWAPKRLISKKNTEKYFGRSFGIFTHSLTVKSRYRKKMHGRFLVCSTS